MIAVQTSSVLAQLLHSYGSIENFPGNNDYKVLQDWLKDKGSKLVPTFPGIEAGDMQTFFQLQHTLPLSPSDLSQFLQLPGIEAAYEKPNDELPG